jgi:Mg2+/Co2+ transporter CorB
MLTIISAIAVLLVFSAFFSGSETALTAASPPLMHQLEKNGNRHAALVNRLHANKERLIGAILLGNNLVNILASALATSVLIAAFGDAGIVYATIAMTLLILIFAEIMPKSYTFTHANRAALAVAPAVNMIVTVLSPATRAIEFFVGGLLRVTGVESRSDDALETAAEELRGAIDLHDSDDRAVKHERAMLRSVLDLSEVQVGEIMVHRRNVVAFDADQTVEAIVAQVLDSPYTRIPLWRDNPDNIVGVLHAKALLRAVRARDGDLDGLDILEPAAEPWFIPESTHLLDQLHSFRQRHEHFALVVDEYGGLMGVVTLEDILEEIVGDISDEHDVAVTGVRPQPDGSYMVEGSVTIRDLNREFEWDLPDEEAATIAGLILHESRRIPDVGQMFRFHRFRFEIVRRQRHQITLVRIMPPGPVAEVEPDSEIET